MSENKDANQEALEQVQHATESDPVDGEELLGSEELKRQYREAQVQLKPNPRGGPAINQTREQAMRHEKEEALKEDIFRAWKDWDLEVDEISAKNAAKSRVEAAIDKYKEEIDSKAARWSFFLRFGPEYADWRREND